MAQDGRQWMVTIDNGSTFTDINGAPEDLKAHFRYPENLFEVQAYQYANYHVTDPTDFYQKRDFWAIPNDPTISSSEGGSALLRPYYQLIRLPGDDTERSPPFAVLHRLPPPFVAASIPIAKRSLPHPANHRGIPVARSTRAKAYTSRESPGVVRAARAARAVQGRRRPRARSSRAASRPWP